jgi:hypothetical protein
MSPLDDAPFQILGWEVSRGGEVKVGFILADGNRFTIPARRLRDLATLLILNPVLSWWLRWFGGKRGCVDYYRASECLIAEARRCGRLDRMQRH